MLSPKPSGRKKTTLSGTDPNGDYVSIPSASIVRSDFHWLPVLDSCIRLHPKKTGQSNFYLKFLASRGILVSIHSIKYKA